MSLFSARSHLVVALLLIGVICGCGGGGGGDNETDSSSAPKVSVADSYAAVGKWADSVVAFAQQMGTCAQHPRRNSNFYSRCTAQIRRAYEDAKSTALESLPPYQASDACLRKATQLKALIAQVGGQVTTFFKALNATLRSGAAKRALASAIRRTNAVVEPDLREALKLRSSLGASCLRS